MADKNKQVAVVVGVGPGLGASLARRFAQGYAVAIMARRAEYLRSVGNEIRAAGGNVLEVPADVTNPVQIEAAFKTIREKLGPPEVLLYNAGGGTRGTVMELTLVQFEGSCAPMRSAAFSASGRWSRR
jgi:NAD(P)-dependent dehydrogenase (short-subunit alcohol dehydrogenase family)